VRLVERREIRALAALGEERRRISSHQLVWHRRRDELVDADAVSLRAALDFRLD
jgi:hypothetical protein